jgi:hypothetical protein
MERQHIKKCFYTLKTSIHEFYIKKSKNVSISQVLRDCQKLEYALEGKIQKLLKMDLEDVQKIIHDKDTRLEVLYVKNIINQLDEPGAGPTPEMRKYIEKKNEQNDSRMAWLVAKGRVEIMREEIERLETIERELYSKVKDI